MDVKCGTLYIVSTPIGNLEDITVRAKRILSEVDIIFCENTKHSNKLLKEFLTIWSCKSLNDHNEKRQLISIIEMLRDGKNIALISDAGTPLISDPGYNIVKECIKNNIKVTAIPGCCAVITALSISGLPSDNFTFNGFLPAKSKARKDKFKAIESSIGTQIFYESPHRILESIKDLLDIVGDNREIVIARELTKTFETILSGTVKEILNILENDKNQQLGEFVLLIKGKSNTEENTFSPKVIDLINQLSNELPSKKVSTIVSNVYSIPKKDIYNFILNNIKNK